MACTYHFPVAIKTHADRTREALLQCLDRLAAPYKIVGWRPGFSNALTVEFQNDDDCAVAKLAWPYHDHAGNQGGVG
jgi:hypothetical protein